MVELERDRLACANLIAVPGCYPTATLLACVPALRAGLVEADIIVDAKSGVSGAGRDAKVGNLFAEVNEFGARLWRRGPPPQVRDARADA